MISFASLAAFYGTRNKAGAEPILIAWTHGEISAEEAVEAIGILPDIEAYPGRDPELEAYLRAFHEPLRRAIRVDRKAALEASEESESPEDAIRRWRGITTPRAC